VIQLLKDRCFDVLMKRSELDPHTDCWVYTGAWDPDSGHGRIKVAGRLFNVSRVAAWVFWDPEDNFDLFDPAVRIYHAHCRLPACFNPDHLASARGPAGVNRALAKLGRFRRAA
jgi:hypothetical protein